MEAIINKMKVTVKIGYGFRNTDNLIDLTMLRCFYMTPELPKHPPKPKNKEKTQKKMAT